MRLVALALCLSGCMTYRSYLQSPKWRGARWNSHFDGMIDAPPTPLLAPENLALVVFIRPSDYEGGATSFGLDTWMRRISVLDEKGRLLGEARGKTHFVAAVTPGDHLFLAYISSANRPNDAPGEGGGVHGLEAHLAAGRVYFVEVTSYGTELLAIKRGQKNWAHRDEWLRSTKRVQLGDAVSAWEGGAFCCQGNWYHPAECRPVKLTPDANEAFLDEKISSSDFPACHPANVMLPGLRLFRGEIFSWLAQLPDELSSLAPEELEQHTLRASDGLSVPTNAKPATEGED